MSEVVSLRINLAVDRVCLRLSTYLANLWLVLSFFHRAPVGALDSIALMRFVALASWLAAVLWLASSWRSSLGGCLGVSFEEATSRFVSISRSSSFAASGGIVLRWVLRSRVICDSAVNSTFCLSIVCPRGF